ncbi:MAG TPA: glucose-1-phosphate adenylyltransferase [Vicinamibacterales bacterium]|jgi:glucose-1-phosphate adenylyltransferase|nr:glucose-1-phosphate adenylyltransferase [Vicinamibacterales bacterium]
MNDVVTLILGGGRGTRLYPLTHMRSKPAVPIGGKYRLIDIPISNCLHAGLKRIFVLTQFNSASLNRHIAQTYRLDLFSEGFVEVLAAEQTPDSAEWFQGTADAVRQAARHFSGYDADYYLILAGDHLYRMDFCELIDAHIESRADITIAAQPVDARDATQMGIFRFDELGRISGFEEKPDAERLAAMKGSAPNGTTIGGLTIDKAFVASMGIYVFSRDTLLDILQRPGIDFGKEIIPAALGSLNVHAYLYRGYWADVGTIDAFYDANIHLTQRGAPFNFFHPHRPIYTHPRFLPSTRMYECRVDRAIVAEGCYLEHCTIEDSVVGIRTHVGRGARVTRAVLLGADYYQEENAASDIDLGIGRDVVLDRVIVDKNARIADGVRLTNPDNVQHADGDGWYIRDGIIVVPKGAVVTSGVEGRGK